MSHSGVDPTELEDLRVTIQRHGAATVVKLSGSAHMMVSSALRDQLVGLVDENTHELVLDLADLEFINSVGLGAIIAAHLRCRHHNGVVKVVAPRPAIHELLAVTKLTHLFPVHASVEDALASN
jgi:anti-sigma B factor antagonist